jgi:hypothetical protein
MARAANSMLPNPALKPLWGFGVVGWIASIVFASLLVVWLQGVNIVFWTVWILAALLGIDGLYWSLSWIWTSLALTSSAAGMTIFTLPVIVAAMFVHPQKMGWWRYACVIFATLLASPLMWAFFMWWPRPSVGLVDPALELVELGLRIAVLPLIVVVVTRSWLVLAYAIVSSLLVVGIRKAQIEWLDPVFHSIAVGFDALDWRAIPAFAFYPLVFGGGLLHWAIRDRIRAHRWWSKPTCVSCGYDASHHNSGKCPECGASLDHLPDRVQKPEVPSVT